MLDQGLVERPGGRQVAWATWGELAGRPLLQFHGTPGSRLPPSPGPGIYRSLNAHVVTFDRPGYGQSSADRDRTLLSVADDALAIADGLGWQRFSVLGISGGGPHALALGSRAAERIVELGLAVGATPTELVDPDDLIALNREGRRRALEEGRESLEDFLAEPARHIASDPSGAIDAAMEDAPLVDREMLNDPKIRAMLAESLREAFSSGPQGWFDDSWCLATSWGFELSDITTPVRMWYGELDRNVPLTAVQKMASQLRVASLEILPGVGHLGWLEHEERVLRELLD